MAVAMCSILRSDNIVETVLRDNPDGGHFEKFQPYRDYCNEEIRLLREGIAQENWQVHGLAAQKEDDICFVIRTLHGGINLTRPTIRQSLATKFLNATTQGLNRSIDLALRLWLMLNFQVRDFETLRHQATCLGWDDSSTLQARIQKLFPNARWDVSPASSRLGPHFTAAFLKRVCGINIEWTTSLCDHLRLDRRSGTLRVFPFKDHLERLLASNETAHRSPIPSSVLEETLRSLELLFPIWDPDTISLLKHEKYSFHESEPFVSPAVSLALTDFDHWRDRLLELREILDAPPVSLAQLWRDRRNPQQFWTFWIALVILILTVFSCVASVIQAWASVAALNLALKQPGL